MPTKTQKMNRPRKEAELTDPVADHFLREGYGWQARELQFYEYNIDLYVFSEFSDLTVAIELKIKNWKRALEQCFVYGLCSDLVLMAMPRETVHWVDQDLLRPEGIGLLAVELSNHCQMMLEPRPSRVMSDSYKRRSIDILKQKGKNLEPPFERST